MFNPIKCMHGEAFDKCLKCFDPDIERKHRLEKNYGIEPELGSVGDGWGDSIGESEFGWLR